MIDSSSQAREHHFRSVNPWPLRRTARRFALYVPTSLLVSAFLVFASTGTTFPLDAKISLLVSVVVLGWTQLVGL